MATKRETGASFYLSHPVGVCKACGCTEEHACYDADYGFCWWVDDTETLCSHCAGPEDPDSLAALRFMDQEVFDQ